MMIEMLFDLINRLGVIIILAVIISKIGIFRRLIIKKNARLLDKLILAFIFGLIGILGTYYGVPVQGALANTRVVGVMVGALLGGPLVGFGAALIAGGHRFLIDIGGFTALACGISTIVEGIMGGYFYFHLRNKEQKWKYALLIGMLAEAAQMVIILLIARPFTDALALVKIIAVPMIIANSIGIALFVGILENIYKEQERIAAIQAEKALKIANLTLPYFRKGLKEEVAGKVVEIIYQTIDIAAVSITNETKILAHCGLGGEHHRTGELIGTGATLGVIKSGEHRVINKKEEINCHYQDCPLKAAVIVPLKEQEKIVGALKLYREAEHSISHLDEELALGLAQLFSTQIEVGRVETQEKLLVDAELRALQAQINPHFLFNAINTIQSFMLFDGKKAKFLLNSLSVLFRKSLSAQGDLIDFEQEIAYIKSYLEIEEARFGDRLKVEYDLQDGKSIKMPPLILQPLVENAVLHGILPKKEGGVVKISSSLIGKDYLVTIEDNGTGIDQAKIPMLLEEDHECGERKSVGLVNIHKRLITLYGKNYGMKIESNQGKGTKVKVRFPIGA
ncbi:sensor histidine kinase [Tindallia californiensis]|uniref:histidine kinase n=1 Tax=Tindallia californiensis TaxID=159292 RepID=A0A1H3KKC0_9FIRM|nr:sensor histidine kinase [Tindallia californiensis]SDY52128.1 two-component system, LytT family, sensor histidine kinase LytS [Tindallia californiensis]